MKHTANAAQSQTRPLLLTSQARLRGRSELAVLDEVIASTPVPVE